MSKPVVKISSPGKRVPFLAGPTGAGKSAAALAIAARHPIAVINADSRQTYHDFPLITAQPSQVEQKQCPHHLYGFLNCAEQISAGQYARLAHQAILDTWSQQKIPLLVGGTGLYLQSLFEGIAPIPTVDEKTSAYWRKRCAHEGSPTLYVKLQSIDPAYAKKIHPHDKQRICRALEVWDSSGQILSYWHSTVLQNKPYQPVKIGIRLSLAELEPILQERIEQMLAAGALQEIEQALRFCPNTALPAWSGIGCRELLLHIQGKISLEQSKILWLKNTRAYAKRQLTWFARDKEIQWFKPHEIQSVLSCLDQAFSC